MDDFDKITVTARETMKIQVSDETRLNYLRSLASKGETQKKVAEILSKEFNIILT